MSKKKQEVNRMEGGQEMKTNIKKNLEKMVDAGLLTGLWHGCTILSVFFLGQYSGTLHPVGKEMLGYGALCFLASVCFLFLTMGRKDK